jgi:hypothetical protein
MNADANLTVLHAPEFSVDIKIGSVSSRLRVCSSRSLRVTISHNTTTSRRRSRRSMRCRRRRRRARRSRRRRWRQCPRQLRQRPSARAAVRSIERTIEILWFCVLFDEDVCRCFFCRDANHGPISKWFWCRHCAGCLSVGTDCNARCTASGRGFYGLCVKGDGSIPLSPVRHRLLFVLRTCVCVCVCVWIGALPRNAIISSKRHINALLVVFVRNTIDLFFDFDENHHRCRRQRVAGRERSQQRRVDRTCWRTTFFFKKNFIFSFGFGFCLFVVLILRTLIEHNAVLRLLLEAAESNVSLSFDCRFC